MGGVLAGFGSVGGERPGLARAGHLLPFLLASALVHALFMAWSTQEPLHLPDEPEARPLSVDLSLPASAPEPQRPQERAPTRPDPLRTAPATAATASAANVTNVTSVTDAPPAASAVDIDAVRSLARRIGREAKAGSTAPAPAPIEDRMAAAIARAYRPGTLVERQTNGGWVVDDGKRRCLIQPRDVPLFLQGMLIIPLCDA